MVLLQAGLFSVLVSLRSCLLSICEGSADVEFFLAYAAHMQVLQSSSEAGAQVLQSSSETGAQLLQSSSETGATLQASSDADTVLLRWCLVDRRIACYPLVASIYLRRARKAFEEGKREDCLGEGVEAC